MKNKKTLLMGILNVTPDSFFDEGKYFEIKKAVQHATKLIKEGADIIDVGGESTRPFSTSISEKEEIKRVIPVIKELKKLNIPISIDTKKPFVAKLALENGATFINDVTGFQDINMIKIAKEFNSDICVMHMQNTPKTMQKKPFYKDGIINELLKFFEKRVNLLLKMGISQSKIILDPGIGFGKTISDNLEIINNIPIFKRLGYKLLFGISRKSFMGKFRVLNITNSQSIYIKFNNYRNNLINIGTCFSDIKINKNSIL